MTNEEQAELLHKSFSNVTKSNALIRKSRHKLSVQKQKAICYICSLIDRDPTPDLCYEFKIIEFSRLCEIDNSKDIYKRTKQLLKELRDKSTFITLEDGTETTVSWINKVWIDSSSGTVKIRLDEDMYPYLFDLKNKFTQYRLYNILKMNSKYSIQLYELFKSYEYKSKLFIDLDEFKQRMNLTQKSYDQYKNIKARVITGALDEINTHSDITVLFEEVYSNKKVVRLKFYIKSRKCN